MRLMWVAIALLLSPGIALAQTPGPQPAPRQDMSKALDDLLSGISKDKVATQAPGLEPPARVETPVPNVPAPEVILAQQPVGKWAGPTFWVSNDLLLLGREPNDDGNRKLAFWSRQSGVFSIDLPADLAVGDAPEGASICAKDGVLQWLAASAPRSSGIPFSTPMRQFIRLVVDPAAKTGRIEKGASEEIMSAMGYDLSFRVDKKSVAQSGFVLLPRANCRLANNVAAVEGLKRIPELFDVANLYVYAVPNGGYVASWGVNMIGADGRTSYKQNYLLLDATFHKAEPQPEKPFDLVFAPPATPFGKLAVKDASNAPDPYRFQVQLTGADGRTRAIATSDPDMSLQFDLSPDGCAARVSTNRASRPPPGARLMITEVRPAPPPPPGTVYVPPSRLGRAGSGVEYSIIDLCSAESRKLLDAK